LNGTLFGLRPASCALLALTFLWSGAAGAQIFGPGARTEFISGFGIRTVGRFLQANDLLNGGEEIDDPLRLESRALVLSAAMVYGLSRKISLIGIFPLFDKELRFNSPSGINNLGAGFGLGDATFLAKWRLVKKNRGRGSFQLSLQGGVKMPTGESDARDPASGGLLPPMLQRGTGTWDPTADVITSYVTPSARWFLTASVGGTLTTAAGSFERGNRLRYDVMVKTRITPLSSRDLFLLIELNGLWQGRSRAGEVEIGSSGGSLLHLSPGIQYLVRQNVILEAGAQFPIVRDLNGTQLAPNASLLFGLRYILVP